MIRRILSYITVLVLAGSGVYLALQKPVEPVSAPVAQLPASVRAASVFALSNEERKSEGVARLSQNPLLMRAAQLKAEDMGKEAYYAHVSPDGETPMYWLDKVGYDYLYVGENLTANIMDEESVVSAWMGSPGHRRNLLDPKFVHMGIGVAEGTYKGKPALFVVQMLATPKPVKLPPAPKPTPAPKPPVPKAPAAAVVAKTPAITDITKTKIIDDVRTLTNPLTEELQATTTIRLFSATNTEPVPFVISTSAIPIELRAGPSSTTPGVVQLPAPEAMREAGKEASTSWVVKAAEFFKGMVGQLSSLVPKSS